MKVRVGLLVMLVALVAVSAASAALPRLAVDKVFRAADLRVQRAHPGSRLTCAWSAGTLTYQCYVWAPSAVSTGVMVGGMNATVIRHRSVQACAKMFPAGSPTPGCETVAAKASCLYAVAAFSDPRTAVTTIVNVCRAGWQRRL